MIEIQGLAYNYPSAPSISFPDFQVPGGGHCLLLGESGSGKTTLLHLIGGLLKLQKGNVVINGVSLSGMSEAQRDHFRGKTLGFIFQKNHLIAALTVKKNLLMAPYLAGVPVDESRIDAVLHRLGLSAKKNAAINELSYGQAQRVAIARAVLNRPAVILADEPTSALDDSSCGRVIDLLLDVATENKSTLLVATHDQRLKSHVRHQIQLATQTSVA